MKEEIETWKGIMEKKKISKNKYPDFSVLMSVYAREKPKNLKLALKSIVEQTLTPKEIILVQDGPITDQLQEVIDQFKLESNDLKEVKLEENVGLGLALRAGTGFVTTDWIARMDSDDISINKRFEIQFSEIVKDSDLAVVGGQIDEFDINIHNVIGKRLVPCENYDILKFAKYRSPFNHPTVVINKEKLNKVGGYRDFKNFEDYYLWIRFLAKDYKFKNVNEIVLHMRSGRDMYSRRTGIKYLGRYYRLRSIMKKLKFLKLYEEIFGDIVMTLNVLIPNNARSIVYQQLLHKK